MIDSKLPIKIYDDTNRGDDFDVSEILFENDNVILCLVKNEWYEVPFEVLIYKTREEVISKELDFYLAENV